MDLLRVGLDLGPAASPATLESVVRAVRVATEVGTAATLASLRRTATQRMRFPTDSELLSAMERLPGGLDREDDRGLSHRARDFLNLRRNVRERISDYPPDFFWHRGFESRRLGLAGSSFDRVAEASLTPWWGMESGLDVLDPELYAALVGDAVAQRAPTPITVRELSYRNPFGEELAAIGTGVEALSKAAGVIETAATLGSRRKIAHAAARVAEETADDRIAMSHVDLQLREEELRRARLENDKAEQELIALRIQNAKDLSGLPDAATQQALVVQFTAMGQLDEADAIAALTPAEAAVLAEFSTHPPELERSSEPDPEEP